MKGRHLISGILHMLFGWLYSFSLRRRENVMEVIKKFFYVFTSETISFDFTSDDISYIETSWGPFKTTYLIINGRPFKVSTSVVKKISSIFKKEHIEVAPLICSMEEKEPEYILQLGRETLYCVEGSSWNYEDVIYNIANLRNQEEYLLINCIPILITNMHRAEEYIKMLKDKGCLRAPYLISPILIKLDGTSKKRYQYLLLGNKYCFKEKGEILIEDIVYFDQSSSGEVHFGAGVDFHYLKLGNREISGIKEYFISRGAELHAEGEKFTTRISLNISTWFKKNRQTVVLGSRGVFYTRAMGNMTKTSFIPYHDIYFINPIGWKLWGRRLEVFGSQNIQTNHTFKNKDYIKILNKIYKYNPQLKESTGISFRSFTWNPFRNKSFVVIGEGLLIHGHPKKKERCAIEGTFINDAKSYGKFYHLFKDVVIDTKPINIRYDEKETQLQIGPFISGTKIVEDEWLKKAQNPIFVTHLWRGSAKNLLSEIDLIRGKESKYREEYRESDQAKEDLIKKQTIMEEYSRKPSLIEFLENIRNKTGCSESVSINTVNLKPLIPDTESDLEICSKQNLIATEPDSSIDYEESGSYGDNNQENNATPVQKQKWNIRSLFGNILNIKYILFLVVGLIIIAIGLFIIVPKMGTTVTKTDKDLSETLHNYTSESEFDKEYIEETDNITDLGDEDDLTDEDEDINPYDEDEEYLEMDVRSFINRFYTEIKPLVNNNENYDGLIKRYFTSDFIKTYLTVDEDVPDGGIGFFDYDFITESQDPDFSKAVIDSIIIAKDKTGQPIAYATVSLINNQNQSSHFNINLINTPDGWKISDYNNLLSKMKEFKQYMKTLK